MLATRRYPQCRSRFLRYANTRSNGDALRKCILSGPYKPTTVLVQAIAATDDSLAIPEHTTMKYTRLLMLAKQLRKCGKLSKGYNKPKWSRFVTIVKQQHKLDEVSYHMLFDILKQYQKEVNELPEQGVPLQAEQYDWLEDTNEEIDEQELKAHYSYMEKIQEVPTADTGTDSEPLEQVQNDTGYNVFANDLQHSKQSKSVSNTCLVETDTSNVIPDSPDMCDDDIQNDQNDIEAMMSVLRLLI
nr:hypothetical protein [Tanacetum cinerariifolium]